MSRIVLPIEVKNRELLGKAWLALHLAQSGHEVAIGNAHEILSSLDILRPEVYFAIGPPARPSRVDRLEKLNDCGTQVVLLDTEGSAYSPERYRARLSKDVLGLVDYYYAWGERSANIADELVEDSDKIVVTGNPRFDLLLAPYRSVFKDDASLLREKYGEYVLVNTNFGVNHTNPEHMLRYSSNSEKIYQHQTELIGEFVAVISNLSRHFPEWTFVVRPHPSESIDIYERLFWPFDNVVVTKDGTVGTWIFAAKAVIHNSCTTGIEAAIMERPVYSYQPTAHSNHYFELPNLVSELAETADNLIAALKTAPSERKLDSLPAPIYESLRTHFGNLDRVSTETIVEHINSLDISGVSGHGRTFDAGSLRKIKRAILYTIGEEAYDTYYREGIGRSLAHRNVKFPSMTIQEFNRVLELFTDVVPDSKFETKRVRKLEHAYWLRSTE